MKKKKTYYLKEETIEAAKILADKLGTSESEAIDRVLDGYTVLRIEEEERIAEKVLQLLDDKYGKWMTAVRLSSRQSERNTDLLIEAVNSIAVGTDIKEYVGTENFESEVIKGARRKVKEDVDRYRQNQKNSRNNPEY